MRIILTLKNIINLLKFYALFQIFFYRGYENIKKELIRVNNSNFENLNEVIVQMNETEKKLERYKKLFSSLVALTFILDFIN